MGNLTLAPKDPAMAKPADSPLAWIRVAAVVLVALAVVGAVAWTVIQSREPQGVDTARGAFLAYTDFVRPIMPPSSVHPSPGTVDQWAEFLGPDMRQWFDASADKLAFIGMRDPERWKSTRPESRRSDALKYLLTQNPWKGGALQNEELDEAAGRSVILYSFGSGERHRMVLERDGRRWQIVDISGAREALDERMGSVLLP